jgi:hypothetical protein
MGRKLQCFKPKLAYFAMSSVSSDQQMEFCVKLSMSSIEGRPLSVSLARFDDIDNPLIGCSLGFLAISGLTRGEVLGRNCRFLNSGLAMPERDRLRKAIRSGGAFMGVLENMRHLGCGEIETFQNLLHLAVISAGSRRYILGIQADVTGLSLDLVDGGLDAVRLQKMMDSVMGASVDSWVHFQEGVYHSTPIYLHIRYSRNYSYGGYGGTSQDDDEVLIEEDVEHSGTLAIAAPDQYMVLAPRFPEGVPEHPVVDESLKWRFMLLGDCSDSLPPGLTAMSSPGPVLSLSQAIPVTDFPLEAFPPQRISNDEESPTSTMKNQLRALNQEDPANVLSARGISKLGMSSASRLRTHFSRYGLVKAVHVPFVFKKRSREQRAAGRGFIVMDSPETVARILAEGSEHWVDEVKVLLEYFCSNESRSE